MQFKEAERLFRDEDIRALAADPLGRRYLKLRSCSRADNLSRLFDVAGVLTSSSGAKQMFEEAFTSRITEAEIDATIRQIYEEGRSERRLKEDQLVNELYKMEVFDWGGLHQNSLEKTIVDNYVKKIWNFDELEGRIEGELHNSLRGYVLCSWYNHWTSILIEDIFRDHSYVLPAVGQVKKIDFFVRQTPFDLKVTYLPEGYVADVRRAKGLRPELTLLRGIAKRHGIPFDAEMPNGKLLEDLWKKVSDHPADECQSAIADLRGERNAIVQEIVHNPVALIKWLYENQGVRRFDASNRLFLILIDKDDFFSSWKLKRAVPRLKQTITSYLDGIGDDPGVEIDFQWEGSKYFAKSDIVLVTKP